MAGHRQAFLVTFGCALLFVACDKRQATQSSSGTNSQESPHASKPVVDACALITREEIETVEQSPVIDTKSSSNPDGAFHVSQCYYTTEQSNRSVSVAVTQAAADSATKTTPKEYWNSIFGRYTSNEKDANEERERNRSSRETGKGQEEEMESKPPKKIDGIGDSSFWTGDRVGGALFVLKNDLFLRVSVGGPDTDEAKIAKSKALAQKALSRL